LLALCYLAIKDDETRFVTVTVKDAKELFIDGLYEIQRGYNLSEAGIDDGDNKDNPICAAGTFNKVVEKLSGVHPDVELLFITAETATLKFPIVVREVAMSYLKNLSHPETTTGFRSFLTLIDQLQKEGIDVIWDKIKSQVADRMFDEFKSAYRNNTKNQDFMDLVDSGEYITLGDLSCFQQNISQSLGYRDYCSQMLLSEKRKWAYCATR
jgi:hypothetical protein